MQTTTSRLTEDRRRHLFSSSRLFSGRTMIAFFVIGAAVRLALLWNVSGVGPRISDEQQYVQLAGSLARGDGLAWSPGRLTSIRPPLYPALLAAMSHLTGEGNLQAVRVLQLVLAFLTAVLVFELGRRAFNAAVGRTAAAFVWLSPALIFLNLTLLSETLFTFLLVAFVLLVVILIQRQGVWVAISAGMALGLGALTRSVLWPLPLVLCPLLALLIQGTLRQRLGLAAAVFAGYAVIVGPWAVRNTRLQHVFTVVDTMGGMNLRMGNYEYTPEDRMWDAVSLTGEKSWVYALTQETLAAPPGGEFTEGMKEKWAQRKAIAYMIANPGTTLRRSAIKFGDFWGLERSFIAGVQQGLYFPPTWFAILASLLIVSGCAIVLLTGFAGIWLAKTEWRTQVLILLPIVLITGVHSVVFGHSRYHQPLVPILAVYGAALAHSGRVHELRTQRWAWAGAALSVALLLFIWLRELIVVDGDRVRAFLERLL